MLRVENCRFLTQHLSQIPGLKTPLVPEGCNPVYYNYVIGFDPEALGLNISAGELRQKVQAALQAEGVPTGQWQRLPVPAQEIFQNRKENLAPIFEDEELGEHDLAREPSGPSEFVHRIGSEFGV